MLVMDVPFEYMRPYFSMEGGDKFIYKLDKGTHWLFYMDASDNVVLRARKDKLGGEDDAMFLAQLPPTRVVPVLSIVWGQHVTVTSMLQETTEQPGSEPPQQDQQLPKRERPEMES